VVTVWPIKSYVSLLDELRSPNAGHVHLQLVQPSTALKGSGGGPRPSTGGFAQLPAGTVARLLPTAGRWAARYVIPEDDCMFGLPDFLLARIAEDEATARAAFHVVGGERVGGWYWSNAGDAVFLDRTPDPVACGPWQQLMHQPFAHHMVRWDPERVVAECDAKRTVVQGCATALEAPPLRRKLLASTVSYDRGRRELAAQTLSLLALPYADHPEYRQEWRP
jgi:hypothetical protein